MSSPKPTASPQVIPSPSRFTECFASDQSDRGNTKWTTLFSSQLAAVIASCPPKSKAPCTFSEAGIASFLAAHRHTQAEIYYILCGRGTVTIENVEYEVTPGTTVFIPGDAEHAVRNEGVEELRWLYVFPGKFEDVVYSFRHEGAYGKPKL